MHGQRPIPCLPKYFILQNDISKVSCARAFSLQLRHLLHEVHSISGDGEDVTDLRAVQKSVKAPAHSLLDHVIDVQGGGQQQVPAIRKV